MKILNYITAATIVLIAFTSCDDNEVSNFKMEDANVSLDTDPNRFIPSVSENNQTLDIPVILAGMPGTFPVTIRVAVDTVGKANPAKEGVDFRIRSKTITFEKGFGTQYIRVQTIDNDVQNKTIEFDLVIDSISRPLKDNPSNRVTISILDNEHPLEYLFGVYTATGWDVFSGNQESFQMKLSASEEDQTILLLEGFTGIATAKFKIRIDATNNTCFILGGQNIVIDNMIIPDVKLLRCFKKEDGYLGYDYEDIPGILSAGPYKLTFTDWIGSVVTAGEEMGGAYFAYKDLTLTKRGGQAAGVNACAPTSSAGQVIHKQIK